ncbi:MAG: cation:proton antiporter [Rhodospirillaceae bacterium]|nr:cation:proton antiporter [Rhodospirillaceae bacterium]
MEVIQDIFGWAFLMGGAFFLLVGGIGVLRMPDFFTRMHAAGITDTMGAGLVLIGLMIESGFTLNTAKLLLMLFFLLFTSPVSSHATAHAALLAGLKPWRRGDKPAKSLPDPRTAGAIMTTTEPAQPKSRTASPQRRNGPHKGGRR